MARVLINPYYEHRMVNLGFTIEQSKEVVEKYHEPHRFYHTWEHIEDILNMMERDGVHDDEFFLTAVFHDVIYDPQRTDNEVESVKFLEKIWLCNRSIEGTKDKVIRMILDTSNHMPTFPDSQKFIDYDLDILKRPFVELIEYEHKIFKEFQYVEYDTYRLHRVNILKHLRHKHNIDNPALSYLIDYVQSRKPNIGLYPGSFNPFHKGHLNILEKAEQIFDKVIIFQGVNPSKNSDGKDYYFPETVTFRQQTRRTGLLTNYINELSHEVTVIRGLRNSSDLIYELNQYRFLQDLNPEIKVISIFCDKEFEHISSSAIRQMKNIKYINPKQYDCYLVK